MGTTAEKLTYLNTTKQKIKDAINNIGGNITSETTFRQYVAALESIYQSMPKISGTGTTLSLSPTLKGLMQTTLKGNTYQKTLSGKNKLGLVGDSAGNVNGIVNNDGTITISGTANITDGKVLFRTTNNIVAGTYTLTISKALPYIINLAFAAGVSFRIPAGSKSVTTTLTTDYESGASLFVALTNGTTYNDTFNIQLTSGSTADTDFEQYCGGTPSPNPAYPQDINVVSGNNTINVCGKNLFDKTSAIDNYRLTTTGTPYSDNNYYISPYIKVAPNTQYTKNSPIADAYHRVCFFTKTGTDFFISYSQDNTFTTPLDCAYIRFCGAKTEKDTTMVVVGNEMPTTYEAYTGATYPINLGSIELCKIGDYKDYFYKDSDKWYLHKEIGEVVFDGSEDENWVKNGYQDQYYYRTTAFTINKQTIGYSNYYAIIPYTTGILSYINSIRINDNQIDVVNDKSNTSVNVFKTWLSTHNTIVYYILETPTNTEITDTTLKGQLEAIYNAYSYAGATNISQTNNDLPFNLDVSALLGSGS